MDLATLEEIWKASLQGWDVEEDKRVNYNDFHDFLLLACNFQSWTKRTQVMKQLRYHGFINFRDYQAPGDGVFRPRTVTIHLVPVQGGKSVIGINSESPTGSPG